MSSMEHFNFDLPADVFVDTLLGHHRKSLAYRRFRSGAEAVRFVIEVQGAAAISKTVIEVDDVRISGAEIREVYDSDEYPLPRHVQH